MRVDKFLKTTRVLKKRTTSKELADQKRITINRKIAKPSSEVKEGDTIVISFGNRELGIEVLEIKKQASKADAMMMYQILYEKKMEKEVS